MVWRFSFPSSTFSATVYKKDHIKCVLRRAVNYLHFRMNCSIGCALCIGRTQKKREKEKIRHTDTTKSNGIAVERTKPQANNNNDTDECACSFLHFALRRNVSKTTRNGSKSFKKGNQAKPSQAESSQVKPRVACCLSLITTIKVIQLNDWSDNNLVRIYKSNESLNASAKI